MDNRTWLCRLFMPQPRRDHAQELARQACVVKAAETEMHDKAEQLRRVLSEITERKRGQNDA